MSVSKEEMKQIIANLSSSSARHVYNALVLVRTKIIKSQNCLKRILSVGLIPKLLKILDTADTAEKKPKNADVALSILGNLCMEPETRKNVIDCSGVESLARHLLESSVESIQNRSCRGLANLALTSAVSPKILNLEVAPRLVKLLQDTKSKECKLTYCRAFRLLGRSREGQKKVVEAGAVLQISKLIVDEDAEVASCALRTVSELIQLGCCSNFARQMIGANVLDKLLNIVESENSNDAHHAISIVFSLTNQPDARAGIGSAGGVKFFINLLREERKIRNMNHISIINALCLCAKEAVNRIKIRELGGLEIFLKALQDPKFAQAYDRIISGFVCFLYDDASFDILLENKLVDVLLKHFQRCCDFEYSVNVLKFRTDNKGLKLSMSDKHVSSLDSDVTRTCDLMRSKSLEETTSEGLMNIRQSHHQKLKSASGWKLQKQASFDEADEFPCELHAKAFQDGPISEPLGSPRRIHTFSIDSPTYEINTEWNMENFSSQTCKQTFNQPEGSRTPSPMPPLSPMSNDTYYSPAQSSPTYSPPRSPESNPGSPGISGLDSEYPPVLSVPYSCSSPNMSPLGWSPGESGSHSKVDDLCYSSSEEDSCQSFEGKHGADAAESKSRCLDKTEDESLVTEVSTEEIDKGGKATRYGKRSLSLRSPSYQLVESCPKRKKTDAKRSDIMKTTEHNILILLSRISVKTDPTSYLLTRPVISCMVDYLFYVPKPHSRCVRTLSRLFKNPHCLEMCLLLSVPVTVYQKIILDSEGIDKESYSSFSQRASTTRRTSRLSTSSEDSYCGGPLTSLDNSFPGSSACSKDNALDFTHGLLASPTSPRSETELSFKVGQSPMSQNMAELCVVEVGQSGLSLLKDLSFSAESPYGRGIISNILVKRSQEDKLLCTVSLLFLCWGSVMQKQYLIKFNLLDRVLKLMNEEISDPGPVFMAVVSGLTFICKLNNIPPKLKRDRTDLIFKPVAHCDNKDKCVYNDLVSDVTFVVEQKSVGANRERLVQSSAMFLAMLEGHYSESSQSEIRIQDTTLEALEYVLHYLQGCSLECPTLNKTEHWCDGGVVELILDALALSDRFLLTDLSQYLKFAVISHHLNSESCASVFDFASFHGFSALAFDCVKVILCSPISLSEKSELLAQMMSGECAELFVETLKKVLRESTE